MARYVIRRLLQAVPTLLGVSVISFVLVYNSPGDPILIRTFDPNITQETREILRRQLGLDQHWALQYISWLTGITLAKRGSGRRVYTQRDTQLLPLLPG